MILIIVLSIASYSLIDIVILFILLVFYKEWKGNSHNPSPFTKLARSIGLDKKKQRKEDGSIPDTPKELTDEEYIAKYPESVQV